MSETLYIIDGHWQIFRAYYAPFRDLTSPTGEPTRATYVFCSMLLKFIQQHKPRYLAMAVDGPVAKLHRRKLFSDYKITRKPTPEDLPPQIDRICQIVQAMGIPVLASEGYEADDIMATAAETLASDQLRVSLVSRDKDLDQVVGDNVVLFDPMKNHEATAETIEREKGYPPSKAIEAQTLMGDKIDNIPGIEGIGPKKAAQLISKYGTAKAVVEHADELTPKLKERVLAGAEGIELSRSLVTLDRHVPIKLSLEDMEFRGIKGPAVRDIFIQLNFKRLLDQLDSLPTTAMDTPEPPADPVESDEETAADCNYMCVDTPEALDELAGELASVKCLAVDTETTALQPMWAEMVGISLAWKPKHAVYIPVKAPMGSTALDIDLVRTRIGPVLANDQVEKIGQNIKYDLIVLTNAGFQLRGKMFDTMIASHVLDSTRNSYKLDDLSLEFLGHRCIPIDQVIGKGKNQTTMDVVPVDAVTPYAAEDADVTFRLAESLREQLCRQGLNELFDNLEMPLMPVLCEMEQRGVIVDREKLKELQGVFSAQSDVLRDRILQLAGRHFNVDSPKQLAAVLFEDLKLPVLKKTKTGPSTDSSVLAGLAGNHELPALVLEYRRLTKLLGTYLAGLIQSICPATGRVHTSFRQTSTVTGRLSSTNPNLQNIPIRTEQGKQIRSAFIPQDGYIFLSADYSQVELRVLAHLCQDPTLITGFERGQDIHKTVAAEIFGVGMDQVTADQRARAKTVNFGIVYGQTAFGLSRTLGIPRQEAEDFIRQYHKRFPQIREFLQTCVKQAKASGFVETVLGRRRRISNLDSRNPARRAAAGRHAINSVVQGSAADLIKLAMVNISKRIYDENRPSRMLLQIHDELLFEIPQGQVEAERAMIVPEMINAISLRVPLDVTVGIGLNWRDAK